MPALFRLIEWKKFPDDYVNKIINSSLDSRKITLSKK